MAASAACGGKAEGPDDELGGSPFLAACTGSCEGGLECLQGVCSRPCAADAECIELSSSAACLQQVTLPERRSSCAIECRSDADCQQLGAGSYCNRAYCVAGNLESLPESFDAIELRQIREPLEAGVAISGCELGAFEARIAVNLRSRQVIWGRCESGASQILSTRSGGSVELDAAGLDFVREAYRGIELSRTRECTPGAELIALDLEQRDGPDMLFADEEHSGCPVPRLGRTSFVSGLAELFGELTELVETSGGPRGF